MENPPSWTPRSVEAALAWARQRFRHRRFRRLSLGGLTLLALAVGYGAVFASLQPAGILVGAFLGQVGVWILAFLLSRLLPVSREAVVWLADRAFGLEDRLVTALDSDLDPSRFKSVLAREVEAGLGVDRVGAAPGGPAAWHRFRRTRRFLRRWRLHLAVVLLLALLLSAHAYLGEGGGPDVEKPDSRTVVRSSRSEARDRIDPLPHLSQPTLDRPGERSGSGATGNRSSPKPSPDAGAGREEADGPGSRNPGGAGKPRPRSSGPEEKRSASRGGQPRKDPALPPVLGKPRRIAVKTSPRFVLPLLDKKGRILLKKRWAMRFLQDMEGVSGWGGSTHPRGSIRDVVKAFQKRAERIMDRRGIPESDRALYLRYLKALAEELAEE